MTNPYGDDYQPGYGGGGYPNSTVPQQPQYPPVATPYPQPPYQPGFPQPSGYRTSVTGTVVAAGVVSIVIGLAVGYYPIHVLVNKPAGMGLGDLPGNTALVFWLYLCAGFVLLIGSACLFMRVTASKSLLTTGAVVALVTAMVVQPIGMPSYFESVFGFVDVGVSIPPIAAIVGGPFVLGFAMSGSTIRFLHPARGYHYAPGYGFAQQAPPPSPYAGQPGPYGQPVQQPWQQPPPQQQPPQR